MNESEIKKKVEEVFKETGLISIPAEVVAMASFYGFSVYELEMDDKVSGMIIVGDKNLKDFDTDKVIVVNSNHAATRKRFTVAHELGHYILKNRPQKCYAHRDSSEVYNPEEKDANSFASALLMPEEDVKKFANSFFDNTFGDADLMIIPKVARRYNVSESAAEVRLKKLEII